MSSRAKGSADQDSFWSPRRIVGVCLAVVTLLFVLQNRDDVTLQLLGIRVTSSLWFAAVVVMGSGIAVGVLLTSRRQR